MFCIAMCLAIHLRHPGTLLCWGEIKLKPNIDCSFMISHPLDQSNPSCVIIFATIFVIQHHKTGIVLLQLGCRLLSVLAEKKKSILCLLLKNDRTCMFIKILIWRIPYGLLEMHNFMIETTGQWKGCLKEFVIMLHH